MIGKTQQELLDAGYIVADHNVLLHPETPTAFGMNKENFLEYCINQRRDKQPVSDVAGIYKLCTYFNSYLHINEFAARKSSSGVYRFSSLSLKGDTVRSAELNKEYYARNLPIIRLYFNGDAEMPLKCAVTGKELENIDLYNHSTGEEKVVNMFENHHMLTINGESVHKISKKIHPSRIFVDKDLAIVKHRAWLLDVMSTVSISQDEHKAVHAFRKSDIAYWMARGALPWALKTKENFKHFNNSVGLNLNYKKFLHTHTLEWFEEHKDSINELDFKNPEELDKFIARFL